METRYYILLLIFLCLSCSSPEKKVVTVNFGENDLQSIVVQSQNELTTQARIKISGQLDCEVEIEIVGLTPFTLSPGIVEFDEWREWYTEPYEIVLTGKGCSKKSSINIEFTFVHDPF